MKARIAKKVKRLARQRGCRRLGTWLRADWKLGVLHRRRPLKWRLGWRWGRWDHDPTSKIPLSEDIPF